MRDSAVAAGGGSALRQGDVRRASAANAGMGDEGLMLIVHVVQILPRLSPASLVLLLVSIKKNKIFCQTPKNSPRE